MPNNNSNKVNIIIVCLTAALVLCNAFEPVSGQVIFFDDFSTSTLDSSNWPSVTGQPLVDSYGINEPTVSYALHLDGNPDGGDAAESAIIDLSQAAGAHLTYWYQQTGEGESPEEKQDLIIEYWSGSEWIELERQLGSGPDMTEFAQSTVVLPQEALHPQFRFRFRSIGSICQCDDWLVDDVKISLVNIETMTTLFSDNMESGSSNWTPQTPWGLITTDYNSPTHCWTDSPGGNYSNSINITLSLIPTINLNGYSQATMQFRTKYFTESCCDHGYTEISTNGGTSWTIVSNLVGTQSAWGTTTINLNSYLGQNIRIRFRFYTDSSVTADGWYIDDVIVQGELADVMVVEPATGFISSGLEGGPFSPDQATYMLRNSGATDINWTAGVTQPWLDVSSTSGTLGPGATSTVQVSINSNAYMFAAGRYTDVVTFTNVTSGLSQERQVQLTVNIPQEKLTASDGASGDNFGFAVAMDGDYAVAGAYYDDTTMTDSGSAYIFNRNGTDWVQQAKLTASDGYSSDNFGYSVAISGNYAIVGAPYDDDLYSNSGSAYIFYNNGASWVQQAKLTPLDGYSSDYFGYSVAISGDYAIVGAYGDDDMGNSSGSAYIFQRNGTSWIQQAKLLASDGYSSDYFGYSVAINGDYAIVGAYYDDTSFTDSGSAYIFTRNGNTWSQQAKLTAADGQTSDYFGIAVSLNDNCAVVGAYGDDDRGGSAGAAYVFRNTSGVWNQEAKLLASDGMANDYFGRAVGIYGDRIIAGAYLGDGTSTDTGAAYLYSWNGSTWTQQLKLTASDGAVSDYFGCSVAIGSQLSIIGAYYDDDMGSNAGAAYVFGVADYLTVTALNPPKDFSSVGFLGGPFDPCSKDYILSNTGPNSLDWAVEVNSMWIEATPASGTLAAGTNITVTVQLTAEANGLVPGTYMDQIVFKNITSDFNQSRQATLRVKRIPGEIELTDSIEPADDYNMPFGGVIISVPVTRHITISNTDASHSLMITNISAPGANFEDFNDNFPTTTLNPANWIIGTGVPTVESLGLNPPSAPYSLTLNGNPSGEESVISREIDLSGSSNVQLNYWYESGGSSEPPDGVNDLVFEYWDGTGWRELRRHLGTDPDTTTFTRVTVTLPAGCSARGVQAANQSFI